MADKETTIFLRDPSLEGEVCALVADIAENPECIVVEAYDDVDDPFHLSIDVYPNSETQRDEFDVTEAPVGDDAETYWPARA